MRIRFLLALMCITSVLAESGPSHAQAARFNGWTPIPAAPFSGWNSIPEGLLGWTVPIPSICQVTQIVTPDPEGNTCCRVTLCGQASIIYSENGCRDLVAYCQDVNRANRTGTPGGAIGHECVHLVAAPRIDPRCASPIGGF